MTPEMLVALTTQAMAGSMVSAKLFLRHVALRGDVVTDPSTQAVIAIVLQRADAGDTAAIRLKAKYIDP